MEQIRISIWEVSQTAGGRPFWMSGYGGMMGGGCDLIHYLSSEGMLTGRLIPVGNLVITVARLGLVSQI